MSNLCQFVPIKYYIWHPCILETSEFNAGNRQSRHLLNSLDLQFLLYFFTRLNGSTLLLSMYHQRCHLLDGRVQRQTKEYQMIMLTDRIFFKSHWSSYTFLIDWICRLSINRCDKRISLIVYKSSAVHTDTDIIPVPRHNWRTSGAGGWDEKTERMWEELQELINDPFTNNLGYIMWASVFLSLYV